MSIEEYKELSEECPVNSETIGKNILCKVEKAIEFWSNNSRCSNFFDAEKGIQVLMSELAVLFFQLFLTSYHSMIQFFLIAICKSTYKLKRLVKMTV